MTEKTSIYGVITVKHDHFSLKKPAPARLIKPKAPPKEDLVLVKEAFIVFSRKLIDRDYSNLKGDEIIIELYGEDIFHKDYKGDYDFKKLKKIERLMYERGPSKSFVAKKGVQPFEIKDMRMIFGSKKLLEEELLASKNDKNKFHDIRSTFINPNGVGSFEYTRNTQENKHNSQIVPIDESMEEDMWGDENDEINKNQAFKKKQMFASVYTPQDFKKNPRYNRKDSEDDFDLMELRNSLAEPVKPPPKVINKRVTSVVFENTHLLKEENIYDEVDPKFFKVKSIEEQLSEQLEDDIDFSHIMVEEPKHEKEIMHNFRKKTAFNLNKISSDEEEESEEERQDLDEIVKNPTSKTNDSSIRANLDIDQSSLKNSDTHKNTIGDDTGSNNRDSTERNISSENIVATDFDEESNERVTETIGRDTQDMQLKDLDKKSLFKRKSKKKQNKFKIKIEDVTSLITQRFMSDKQENIVSFIKNTEENGVQRRFNPLNFVEEFEKIEMFKIKASISQPEPPKPETYDNEGNLITYFEEAQFNRNNEEVDNLLSGFFDEKKGLEKLKIYDVNDVPPLEMEMIDNINGLIKDQIDGIVA